MSRSEEERFRVHWVQGEHLLEHPHVIDTETGQIVSFRRSEASKGNQLFYDPEKAKKAAERLNRGANPDEMSVFNPEGKKTRE